jgi:acyl dehydratase
VFINDTIYARTTILDKKESNSKPDRGVVYVETIGFNQRNEDVISFKRKVLIKKRA